MLEKEAKQAITIPDRADLIEADKSRRKAAVQDLTNQRMASIQEAITIERLENRNYVSH